MQVNDTRTRDLIITRTFDAPLDLVWKAWTEPAHVMRWWGPNGFTCPSARVDFREGGTSLVCMRAPAEMGGQDMYSTWDYTRIVPLERIEFTSKLADAEGNPVDPAALGLPPEFPTAIPTVITFKAVGTQTEMTVTEYGLPDTQMFTFAEAGLNQSLDKMAATFK